MSAMSRLAAMSTMDVYYLLGMSPFVAMRTMKVFFPVAPVDDGDMSCVDLCEGPGNDERHESLLSRVNISPSSDEYHDRLLPRVSVSPSSDEYHVSPCSDEYQECLLPQVNVSPRNDENLEQFECDAFSRGPLGDGYMSYSPCTHCCCSYPSV